MELTPFIHSVTVTGPVGFYFWEIDGENEWTHPKFIKIA